MPVTDRLTGAMLVERRDHDAVIHACPRIDARVDLPGSKSLTQRHLVCAALADGVSTLQRPLLADDSAALIDNLRRIGVRIDADERTPAMTVYGGRGLIDVDDVELDAGAAGTAMRFLTAVACLGYGRCRIDGSRRMRQRPIGPLVDGLTQIGARIGYDGDDGFPPLAIDAHGLAGGTIEFDEPPSSQFISAILMAAPYAAGDVLIRVRGTPPSRPYIAMTTAVMRSFGVETLESDDGARLIVAAGQRYRAGTYDIEPDASSASYFLAAAAITGGRVRIAGLGGESTQGDAAFAAVLEQMGCRIARHADALELEGPPGGCLRGVDVDLSAMPDTVQTLAVAALFADGPTRIRNVANLRLKETDRLAALAAELDRVGAKVDVYTDGLTIFPTRDLSPAEIETYDDHRMAMSFAVAGLRLDGLVIRNAACVSKSFPGFFEVFGQLSRAD